MQLKRIHVIINPASGREEPILSYLNKAFAGSGIAWDISVTKQEGDASALAANLVGQVDAVAVYGGDGSVAEVARVLCGTNTPLAILPGGTANVLSKELHIPQDTADAIALLASGQYKIVRLDAATANDELFLLRVNFGIMADMVLEATRELKDKVGQLAYGITAVKTLIRSDATRYELILDGTPLSQEGVALTVTNCGSIGLGEMSFLPDIRVDDGLLDVIVMHSADLLSVLRIAGATLAQAESPVLDHWKCREVVIRFEAPTVYILDDCERQATEIRIKTLPAAIAVVVPA